MTDLDTMEKRRPGRPRFLSQRREARLSLEEAQYQALEQEAEKRGISVSALVRLAVEEFLSRQQE